MIKKVIFSVVAVAMALSFAACSSVQIATVLNKQALTADPNCESVGHIHGKIWGVYLLGLPLFSGSSVEAGKSALFTDTVTVNNAVDLVTKEAKNRMNGTVVADLSSETTTVWLIPTALFWFKSVEASGNVLK